MFKRIILWSTVLVLSTALVLAGLPAAAPAAAQDGGTAAAPRVTGELLDTFSAEFAAELDFYGIPGGALAVVQDGELVYAEGFGVRDVASGAPFTAETRFRIGSTTKSMTALLIAQLVDEGLLDWDTPVVEILPNFQMPTPELTAQTRVRDLMGMATGLASDPLGALYWGDWSVDDLLAQVAAQTITGDFGAVYNYNNEVYAVAGYVAAQAATGEATFDAYERMLQTRIFAPLGMASTSVTDDESTLGDDFSVSYGLNLLSWPAEPWPYAPNAPLGVVAPAGAVWSTVGDMARYVMLHLAHGVTPDGQRLVSEENLAVTWAPGVEVPSGGLLPIDDVAYGMGWLTMTYGEALLRYHDGAWNGHATQMITYPDANIGLIIYTNHELGTLLLNTQMMARFTELLYEMEPLATEFFHGQYDVLDANVAAQLATLPPPEIELANVEAFLGTYEHGWTLTLGDDNILRLTRPGWVVTLRPVPRANTFVPVTGISGGMIEFTEEAALLYYISDEPIIYARVK